MSATYDFADGFEWAGGTGRFGTPGVLSDGAPVYVLGDSMVGAFCFSIKFAFWWAGGVGCVLSLKSPYYTRYNPAHDTWEDGGQQGPEPPKCLSELYQEDMGALYVDFRGGLRFLCNNKQDNWDPPITFELHSSEVQFLSRRSWNTVELKFNLGRLSSHGTRLCGAPDPFGNAIAFMAARVNGIECLRTSPSDLALSVTQIAFCGCLNSKNDMDIGAGFLTLTGASGNSQSHIDDLAVTIWSSDQEVAGEQSWLEDARSSILPAAAAGAAAQWTPVGAATNIEAAASNDAVAYNRTNQTGKRDSFALQAAADTSPVLSASPVIVGRAQYHLGAPAVKALYRRAGIDYLTPESALPTAFAMAGGDAGIPLSGETIASLSAGEVGYTTE